MRQTRRARESDEAATSRLTRSAREDPEASGSPRPKRRAAATADDSSWESPRATRSGLTDTNQGWKRLFGS